MNAVRRNAYFDKTSGRMAVVPPGLTNPGVTGRHRQLFVTAKLCQISANGLP